MDKLIVSMIFSCTLKETFRSTDIQQIENIPGTLVRDCQIPDISGGFGNPPGAVWDCFRSTDIQQNGKFRRECGNRASAFFLHDAGAGRIPLRSSAMLRKRADFIRLSALRIRKKLFDLLIFDIDVLIYVKKS